MKVNLKVTITKLVVETPLLLKKKKREKLIKIP